MRTGRGFGFLVVAALAASAGRASGTKPTVKSVGESLMCQCGCPETVTLCNHTSCSSRGEMQERIEKEIAAGKGEAAILQDFILTYGVKVLATPPARGFNLTVWVLPLAGFLGGLAVVMLFVRRWRKPQAEGRPQVDSKLLAAVEEEMRKAGVGD